MKIGVFRELGLLMIVTFSLQSADNLLCGKFQSCTSEGVAYISVYALG